MGVASSFFFRANSGDEETLHTRLVPSEDQVKEQQDRWNHLRDHMVERLRADLDTSMNSWLQGSYKFKTQIRPVSVMDEYDIDLGLYAFWPGSEGDRFLPSELRETAMEVLSTYSHPNLKEIVDPPKERCLRIRYDDSFHIDLPIYHYDTELDTVRLAVEGDGWEDSDPKAIYHWFVDRFDDSERALARRLVQYIKGWAAVAFPNSGRPSSILLTVLVAEALDHVDADARTYDDDAFAAIARLVFDRMNTDPLVVNPADPDEREDLSARLNSDERSTLIDALGNLADIAEEASVEEDLSTSINSWEMVFGHMFPMPDPETLEEMMTESAGRQLVSITMPEVHVRAVPEKNGLQILTGTNAIYSVPHDYMVHFNVTNSGLFPSGTQIEWVVRNSGSDAEAIGDMGHNAGFGAQASRHTRYLGTHFMDCIVRQGRRVIARRRIPVQVVSSGRTARQLPQGRPANISYKKNRRNI